VIDPAFAVPLAAATTAVGYWINRRIRGWLPDDVPRPGRKQHRGAIPMAGILLLPTALLWLLWTESWWLAAAATIVAITGYVDDLGKERQRDLDWRLKAVALLFAAGLAVAPLHPPWIQPWQFAIGLGFVFVLTNATNFLDNTDGVACGLSATTLLMITGGTGPLAAIGFGALGLLLFNWPRPLVFLGDAGAYLLGLIVGTAALRGGQPLDWQALAPVALQLADFAQVVIARIVLGLAPWVGDRRHLTHIVMNLGLHRTAIAPLFAAAAWLIVRSTQGS